MEKRRGRPLKYNEPTKRIAMRVPISKIELVRKAIKKLLAK